MPELADAWQTWLAENLLRGVEPAEIVEMLTARGVVNAKARVDAALAHPYLRVALPIAETLRRRESLLAIQASLATLGSPVPRVSTMERDVFLDEHYAVGRPVVMAIEGMRALERWTFAYLASEFGALSVEVQDGRDGGAYQREFDRFCTRMTLGELLARITQPTNDVYLTAKNRLLEQPGAARLLEDLTPLPSMFTTISAVDAGVWIGAAGTLTPLHFDWRNLAIVQIRGRKRIAMVPPTDAAIVGNRESRFADHAASVGHVQTIELGPGDMLFVPVGWFHEVTALEPSISVSLTNFVFPNSFAWSVDTSR